MTIFALALAAATLETLAPCDVWGGRTRHPAVVNPPVAADAADVLSLSGEWDFHAQVHHLGATDMIRCWNENLGPKKDYRKILVPGNWETQGVGKSGLGVWHLGLDNAPKELRHAFSGEGLYRRTVKIPASWAGKRIWLAVGGVNCRGWFAVNEKGVGLVSTYCGAWKYDVTDLVRPGEDATVHAMIDNAVGSRNTQPNNAHRWGGFTRDIAFVATPRDCYIDDAWVRGDFDKRLAEAHVDVGGKKEEVRGKKLRVTVEGEVVEQSIAQTSTFACGTGVSPVQSESNCQQTERARCPFHAGSCTTKQPNNQTILKIALRDFRPWSPEHPNLYTAKVELVSAEGKVLQTRFERFGVRKFEVRGREFYLNGKPFYLRGFGDDSTYPITGSSPCDRDYHRRHLARARAAGFNYVRLHTHCELPEYMDACDELGILVQLELSYYFDQPMDHFDYDPKRDIDDRFVTYRRHPSWCVSSCGNEGKVGPSAGALVYEYLKRTDPDRLVQEEDGPSAPDDYGRSIEDFCTGPMKVWQRGGFNPPMPFVCHEYLNLSVKQDSRLEPQFTGIWKPLATRERRAEALCAAGLTHAWGDRFQDAQHALQRVFQKDGVERARIDPFCDGYCYWTIADVGVENKELGFFTAQGLFDVFWNPKRAGSTPETFAAFNSPTVVLADFCDEQMPTNPATAFYWGFGNAWNRAPDTNRVFVTGQRIPVVLKFAHYGEAPVEDAKLAWTLRAADGRSLADGSRDLGLQALGAVRDLDRPSVVVPTLDRPCAAKLEVSVSGREGGKTVRYANDWDLYLFPERQPVDGRGMVCSDTLYGRLSKRYPGIRRAAEGCDRPVFVCEAGDRGEDVALAAGRRVIVLSGQTGEPNYALGWWWIGKQVGTAIVKHPVLGDFPTGDYLSPLYFRIIKTGTELPVCGLKEDDLVIAGEGGKGFYLYLSEEKLGNGARRVRISGLDVLSETPEGVSLLDNAVRYLLRK